MSAPDWLRRSHSWRGLQRRQSCQLSRSLQPDRRAVTSVRFRHLVRVSRGPCSPYRSSTAAQPRSFAITRICRRLALHNSWRGLWHNADTRGLRRRSKNDEAGTGRPRVHDQDDGANSVRPDLLESDSFSMRLGNERRFKQWQPAYRHAPISRYLLSKRAGHRAQSGGGAQVNLWRAAGR